MRKGRFGIICLLAMALLLGGFAAAIAGGTPEQAKALADEAVKFYKASGSQKAFAEFSKTDGKFVKGDLYIVAVNTQGITLAHGGNAKLIGKEMLGAKDPDGIFFIKELIETAKTKGSGWVNYKWPHPETKKLALKTSYVIKADDNVAILCGAYK